MPYCLGPALRLGPPYPVGNVSMLGGFGEVIR